MREMHWTTEPVTDDIARWDENTLSLHYENWTPWVFYDFGFGLVGKMANGVVLVTSWRKPKWFWRFTHHQLRKAEVYKMEETQQKDG